MKALSERKLLKGTDTKVRVKIKSKDENATINEEDRTHNNIESIGTGSD